MDIRIIPAILLFFICNAFSITVETLDEQIDSQNLTILRIRVNNDTDKYIYNVKLKYYIYNQARDIVIDTYDLGGAEFSLDSINSDFWSLTINIDTLAPGTFPYEAGLCLGVHNIDWSPRNKSRDPSYIASPDFVTNNNIELNLFGNHLPDAEPLALVSGTKMLLNNGDSIPFAWHGIPKAEKYRLSIFSSDSQMVFQRETYENRATIALDTGSYLWRVEAKNSTTDYDSVGFGSLMNNLHIGFITPSTILEQKILGVESVSGHKDTPMLVVGWGEYADLREWDKPHLNRTFLDENESESCWAIAIKNLNRFYGGNLTLDEIRWYAKKETMSNKDSIHAFLFGGNAAQTSAEIQTGLKYALDSIMNFQSISKISINELMEYIKQDHVIYVSTKGHAMLIDGFFKTTNDVYFRYINIDNLGTSGIFSPNNLFDQHTRFIIIDTPKSIRNMDPLLGVEKFDNFNGSSSTCVGGFATLFC